MTPDDFRTVASHAAHTHLGPVHTWMAAHGVSPNMTNLLLGAVVLIIAVALARNALKSVFGGN